MPPRTVIPPHNAGHPKLSLGELENNLAEAQKALETAQRDTAIARKIETDALNRLRDVQKQIDQRVNELKMADKHGDWHQGRHERQVQMDAHHEGGRG